MQSAICLCFAAIVACAHAQVYVLPGYSSSKQTSSIPTKKMDDPREMIWMSNAGKGKVFGKLGSTDDSVFGKIGYKQNIYNDYRGKLDAEAYGSRVLTDYGGSSVLGGKIDWTNANENARASLDVNKEVGGGSSMTLTGDGVWKVDKNTRLVAGGELHKTFGHSKPEFGVQAKVEHDFK